MDGGRFDELTRGLASAMSRRKMLRGLAGAAAAGIAGGFVPTSISALGQGKPYLRAYECPGVSLSPPCENLSDSFSRYDATTCEARGDTVVQLALPTHNGLCDVPVLNEVDFTEGIRDRYGKASFEDACAAHDCCYGTCGTSQELCDGNLYLDMTGACNAAYPINMVQRLLCIDQATAYYLGLQSPRNTAWKEQQQLKCGCCAQDPTGTVVVYGFEPSGLVYEGYEDQQACEVRWYVTGFAAGTYAMTITVQGGQIEDLGPVVLSGPEEIIYMNVARQIFDGDVIVMTVGGVSTDPLTVTC